MKRPIWGASFLFSPFYLLFSPSSFEAQAILLQLN